MSEGICDACGEQGVLRELSGAPAVGVCVCAECYYEDKKGSEMPVLETAPINARANESDAMATSANVGESPLDKALAVWLDGLFGTNARWLLEDIGATKEQIDELLGCSFRAGWNAAMLSSSQSEC